MEDKSKKELIGNPGMVLFDMARRLAGKGGLRHLAAPKNPASLTVCKAPVVLTVSGRKSTAGGYKGESKMVGDNWLLYDLMITNNDARLQWVSVKRTHLV